MDDAGFARAYARSAPLVHTLGLSSLGSVDEAEDLVRDVFVAAARDDARGAGALEPEALVGAAATRIGTTLESRAREQLALLDRDAPSTAPVSDVESVSEAAERLLLAAALERLPAEDRELLERVLVRGEDREELALMLGLAEEELARRLVDALLALWTGPRLDAPHAPAAALAARALRIPAADDHRAHIAQCRDCKQAWRGLHDLSGRIARGSGGAALVPPRATLEDRVRQAIASGEVVEPARDWRQEAADRERRELRRRTMIMGVGLVLIGLFAGLAVVVSQWLVEPERDVIAAAPLTDPRTGGTDDVGELEVHLRDGGRRVLSIRGPFSEYPDASLVVWLTETGGHHERIGVLASSYAEIPVPEGLDLTDAAISITREPWAGDLEPVGEVVAIALLG
ncbi:anti-sigma factor domain-containing protein [Demequina pelophila]|uniref:anti-sigma factor domain-containing protein n=1 Tax=Demequina pelophila TaxID=1638984 RepID=UPI0007816390|nr:anti-sigma factor [Demequina pelophila]